MYFEKWGMKIKVIADDDNNDTDSNENSTMWYTKYKD